MATYAELSCLNKILLQKMNRQQKKIRKLTDELVNAKTYETMLDSLQNCLEHNSYDELCVCVDCDKYNNMGEATYYFDEPYCERCSENYNFKFCECCGNVWDLDDEADKEEVLIDFNGNPYCSGSNHCETRYEEAMTEYFKKKYKVVMDEVNSLPSS